MTVSGTNCITVFGTFFWIVWYSVLGGCGTRRYDSTACIWPPACEKVCPGMYCVSPTIIGWPGTPLNDPLNEAS